MADCADRAAVRGPEGLAMEGLGLGEKEHRLPAGDRTLYCSTLRSLALKRVSPIFCRYIIHMCVTHGKIQTAAIHQESILAILSSRVKV
jgi:hypothetical protein